MIPQMAGATFVGPMDAIRSRASTAPLVSTSARVASTGVPRTALRNARSVSRTSLARLVAPIGVARGRPTSRRRGAAGLGQSCIRLVGCGTRRRRPASVVRPALTCKPAPGTRTWSKWSTRAAPTASSTTPSRLTIAPAVGAALTSAHSDDDTPYAREIRLTPAGSIASIRPSSGRPGCCHRAECVSVACHGTRSSLRLIVPSGQSPRAGVQRSRHHPCH